MNDEKIIKISWIVNINNLIMGIRTWSWININWVTKRAKIFFTKQKYHHYLMKLFIFPLGSSIPKHDWWNEEQNEGNTVSWNIVYLRTSIVQKFYQVSFSNVDTSNIVNIFWKM